MFDFEKEIELWRRQIQRKNVLSIDAIDELEEHLRENADDLQKQGLTGREALLLAITRMGNTHKLAQAFSVEYGESVWRQWAFDADNGKREGNQSLYWILFLGLAGGLLFHTLSFLFQWDRGSDAYFTRYFLNLSFCGMTPAVIYYLGKATASVKSWLIYGGLFLSSGVLVNIYPYEAPHHTQVLTFLHIPLFLWLSVLPAYCGRNWRNIDCRMSFVRASGEIFIYTVLLGCGLGVFLGMFFFIYETLGFDVLTIGRDLIFIPGCLACAAVSVYLVDAKRSVVENFAPVLAKIFSPLFLLLIVSFLIVVTSGREVVEMEREFLIGFDLLLVLTIGLVVYSISARDPRASVGLNDYLLFALITVTILADLYALSWIGLRIGQYGFSANKVAALGENLFLLANLFLLFVTKFQFLRGRGSFQAIESMQVRYLWIYWAWTGVVALLFPFIFGFQ